MRNRLLLSLCHICLACSGCATVGGALVEGLVDATFNAIFDSDDDCEIDPHVLKRKGIEPGSKVHRRLCAEEEAQQEFYESNNL